MVIAASHDISSPRDSVSGLATGKRKHQPFVITKEVDKSSPLLYNILVNNENITEWELQFWSPGSNSRTGFGIEKQCYTVKLTNANISDISFRMPNNKNPELVRYAEYEEISFTYEKISWSWVDGGIMAEDDWSVTNP